MVSDREPRSYRRIFLAAVGGLILAAADHPASNAPEADQAAVDRHRADEAQKAAETVSNAIHDTIRPVEKDAGCQNRADKRDSDLCAQWKAADAARDAADYSFWTMVVSAAGTALLVWTLWETRANSRRELRAYVSVQPMNLTFVKVSAVGYRAEISFSIKNGGSTPAYGVIHGGNATIFSEAEAERFFRVATYERKRAGKASPFVLHSGREGFGEIVGTETMSAIDVQDGVAGRKFFCAFGFVEYRDTFRRLRRTNFAHQISGEDLAIATGREKTEPGQIKELHWITARFHNTAT